MIRSRNRGSALLSAIMFGTLVLIIIASVLKYSMGEYQTTRRSLARDVSFHLAEAGIERAIYALQFGEIIGANSSQWTNSGSSWTKTMNDVSVGNEKGSIDIAIYKISDDQYQITSLGTKSYGLGKAQRAIKVSTDLIEDPSKPNNHYRPDFIFKNTIKLGLHNGGPSHILSWNSKDSIDPILENTVNAQNGNTGFDCVLASMSSDSDAIIIDKLQIDGMLGVGGEIPDKYKVRKYKDAELRGPNTASNVSWDQDRIIPNFKIDIPAPEYPDPDTYDVKKSYDQNYWQNSTGPITLGQLNQKTHITAQNAMNMNDVEITIQGEVALYVDGAINANGSTKFKMNGENSSLVLYSKGSMNFSRELVIDSRFPKQLLILQPTNNTSIVIHSDRFSGFIYAPDCNIYLHGTANSSGTRKNYFLGGMVGNSLDNTYSGGGYGLVLASDSSMRNQNSKTDPHSQTHIVVMKDWSEISPSSVNASQ